MKYLSLKTKIQRKIIVTIIHQIRKIINLDLIIILNLHLKTAKIF